MSKIIPLTIEGFHHYRHHHHHKKTTTTTTKKLLPLSIDVENDDSNDDDDYNNYDYDDDYDDNYEEEDDEDMNDDETEECFLLEQREGRRRQRDQDVDGRRRHTHRIRPPRRRRRRETTTVRTHHFHLPSVQIPSSSSSSRTNNNKSNCSILMYCCTFMILLISLIGYFGGGSKIPDYYYYYDDGEDGDNSSTKYVHDDAIFGWQKDKGDSSSSSSDLEEVPSYHYDYNFQPTIRNDYSNVSSRHDLFELSTQISIHCSYNRTSCPCQPEPSSSSSSTPMIWPSSSSFDESDNTSSLRDDKITFGDTVNGGNSAGTSSSNINSRLVPRPGNLDGWETAFNWNVQTASSKRGTDSNIVFVGDSITELWRGTRLGQQLDNDRKKTASIGGGGGGGGARGGVTETARTFDDLFRTTIRTDKYSADNDSDSFDNGDGDDDDFSDDEDEYNSHDEDTEEVDNTNQTDISVDEERPLKEISFRGLPLGVAGDQTTNLLWRMQNGELPTNLSPSIFVVLIGTNDLSYDECSADNIILGILQCVEYLLEERPDAQILLHGLLPRTLDRKGYLMPPKESTNRDSDTSKSSPTYFWSTIKAVNSELKRYADRRQSVEYLDSSDLFLKRRNQIDLDLIPDGTHPSIEGYQLFGSNLQKKILKMVLNKEEDEENG